MVMPANPSVLLTIDYEPWFALTRRYDANRDLAFRKKLDGGFTRDALNGILAEVDGKPITIYLVGEIAAWYPEIPAAIVSAGHELGLHCQYHRPLIDIQELKSDLKESAEWRKKYQVIGYRAPMVGIAEDGYRVLIENGIQYSSSVYAPTGTRLYRDGLREIPVSSLSLRHNEVEVVAPRQFNSKLLAQGEVPFGSSFMIGLTPRLVLRRIEQELKKGLSPVLILHPYEIVRPPNFLSKMAQEIVINPQLFPFLIGKRPFLRELVANFPLSTMRDHLKQDGDLPN